MIYCKQICERLSQQFNTTSLTRPMHFRHTLSNLSKDPKQSIEVYLRSIKHIVDSLASIRTLVPDIDLVQLTLKGFDKIIRPGDHPLLWHQSTHL